MGVKVVSLNKTDTTLPVLQMVRGDQNTQVIRFLIERYAGGVDLSGLSWAVEIVNANGDEDKDILGLGTIDGSKVAVEWELGQIVAAYEGITTFSLQGIDEEKRIWRSSNRIIKVIDSVEADPDYDPQSISELQQLIIDVGIKVSAMEDSVKDFEDRISSAEVKVDEFEATIDHALDSYDVQMDKIDSALDTVAASTNRAVNAAVYARETADNAAEYVKNTADKAANLAKQAADNANTAGTNADNAVAELLRKAANGDFNGKDGRDGRDGIDGTNGRDGQDGYTPVKGIDYFDGEPGRDGVDGRDGRDGVDGINGRDGIDGQNGSDGADGFSPVITVEDIDGGHKISITDKTGTKEYSVLDGVNGRDGTDGRDGKDGRDGVDGKDWIPTEEEISSIVQSTADKLDDRIENIVVTDGNITDDTVISINTNSEEIEIATEEELDEVREVVDNKVGYSEVENDKLNMYSDNTKSKLITTIDFPQVDTSTLIEVSETQPTDDATEIWIDPNEDGETATGEDIVVSQDDDRSIARAIAENDEATTRLTRDLAQKVGYSEVVGNQLLMYSDSTKSKLLATMDLPISTPTDVQINGTSITQDGVANIPYATMDIDGILRASEYYGTKFTDGYLYAMPYTVSELNRKPNGTMVAKGTLLNVLEGYEPKKQFELIERISLTEDTAQIVRLNLGLKKLAIYVSSMYLKNGESRASGNFGIKVNNSISTIAFGTTASASTASNMVMLLDASNGLLTGYTSGNSTNTYQSSYSYIPNALATPHEIDSIESIAITQWNGYKFESGSVFEIWGVKA